MQKIQNLMAAFIEDVNKEDGIFLLYSEKMTNGLFSIIKWAGVPFIIYLLVELSKL